MNFSMELKAAKIFELVTILTIVASCARQPRQQVVTMPGEKAVPDLREELQQVRQQLERQRSRVDLLTERNTQLTTELETTRRNLETLKAESERENRIRNTLGVCMVNMEDVKDNIGNRRWITRLRKPRARGKALMERASKAADTLVQDRTCGAVYMLQPEPLLLSPGDADAIRNFWKDVLTTCGLTKGRDVTKLLLERIPP